MIRVGANLSLLFTDRPLPERVEAARAAGFEAVEVQFPYPTPAEELARALRAAALPLAVLNVPAGDLLAGGDGLACVPGAEARFASALDEAVDYLRALGDQRPANVNVLPGRVPVGTDPAACAATFTENLGRAMRALTPCGVHVVVEALNRHDQPRVLLATHAEVQAAIAAVPGVREQYDAYHQARMGAEVVAEITAALGRGLPIGHVQFADVPGRHEPGTGGLDLAGLVAALRLGGYGGFVCAEYVPLGRTEDGLGYLPGLLAAARG